MDSGDPSWQYFYESDSAAVFAAVGRSWRFVPIRFFIAFVLVRVQHMVVSELAFDAGEGQVRHELVADSDRLNIWDDVHDEEEVVGHCEDVSGVETGWHKVLS